MQLRLRIVYTMNTGDNKRKRDSGEGEGYKNDAEGDGDDSINSRANDSNPGSSVDSWDFENDCYKSWIGKKNNTSATKQKDDDDDGEKTVEYPKEKGRPNDLPHIEIHYDEITGVAYYFAGDPNPNPEETKKDTENTEKAGGKEHQSFGSKKEKK